jgi:DNA integrity scanning protein DisA with diadenylate cyclase activity
MVLTVSNKNTFGYKLFDCTEPTTKVNQFISLLKEPDIQSFLKEFIDAAIATSELNILKRITTIEEKLGIIESEALTIPQKLEEIESKVNTLTHDKKLNLEDIIQPDSIPQNVTDIRADFLIRHLQENEETPKLQSPFVNMKLPFCNSKEFRFFVNNVLPEQYKPKSLKNIRKLKKDIFENAVQRYKDLVSIDKSFHGNKELRLVMPKQIPLPCVTG